MIGLDTCAVIDLFKGVGDVKKAIVTAKGPFVSTDVNYAEVMFGLNPKNPKSKAEEQYYDEFFSSISMLKLTEASSKKAAAIYWELREEGKVLEPFDCLIAGILLANGVTTILTENKRHFERVNGLKVIGY